MTSLRHALFGVLLSITFGAGAVVYDTRFGGSSSGTNLDSFLQGRTVLTEPVEINGVRLELKVAWSERQWGDLLSLLATRQDVKVRQDDYGMLLLNNPTTRKRLLVLHFGMGFPMLEFSMELPGRFPSSFQWPRALVLPPGGEPLRYYYFPNREAYYGEVRVGNRPKQAILLETEGLLRGRNFRPISGELTGNRASGELFLNTQTREIAWCTVSNDKLQLYVRKLKGTTR